MTTENFIRHEFNHVCEVIPMGELRVRIPNELHKALKQEALNKGTTLKKLVTNILEKYIKSLRERERKGEK